MLREALAIELALIALAFGVASLDVVPDYTGAHASVVGFVCVLAFMAGLVCVTLAWRSALSRRGSEAGPRRAVRAAAAVGVTLGVLCWVPVAFLVYAEAAGPDGFFGRGDLVAVTSLGGQTLYLYHSGCFPPDNRCECDGYHSLVFRQNRTLPLLHRVARPSFYVDESQLELRDGVLTLKAEPAGCAKDVGKTLRVHW